MRRLIYALLGIRAKTGEQHIADLEQMLSELVSARETLEGEIAETTRRLLAAQERRDEFNRKRGQWLAPTHTIRT